MICEKKEQKVAKLDSRGDSSREVVVDELRKTDDNGRTTAQTRVFFFLRKLGFLGFHFTDTMSKKVLSFISLRKKRVFFNRRNTQYKIGKYK